MEIDELIKELERVKNEHGNLEVGCLTAKPGDEIVTDIVEDEEYVWIGNF